MNRPQSSRRKFLTGEAAIDAVGDLGRSIAEREAERAAAARREAAAAAANTGEPPAKDTTPAPTYLVQIGRRAMACQFEVLLNACQENAAADAAVAALDLVDKLEEQLTVYRHQSEVSRLNAIAAIRPVPVEEQLFGLLTRSVELFRETQGAFDITTGPLIQAWGFLRRQGRMPTREEIDTALQRTGSQHLLLDPERKSVAFQQEGLSINLGAIGKGYALDRCASLLSSSGVRDFMMHGGSSSILARGQRAGGQNRAGWTIGVQHPLRADRRLAELQLVDRAVGTSGTGTQYFYHQGKRYGHIIDPRTGQPAEGMLSTTVVAPTAATADALATAFYVLGVEQSAAYCQTHPEISALMTTAGRAPGSVEVHALNAEGLDWKRLTD